MHLALRRCILVAFFATGSLTGCSIAKQIFTPEQARLDESSARQRAEVAQYPACSAGHAESCRISGNLIRRDQPDAAAALYSRACDLHDELACAKTPGTK